MVVFVHPWNKTLFYHLDSSFLAYPPPSHLRMCTGVQEGIQVLIDASSRACVQHMKPASVVAAA